MGMISLMLDQQLDELLSIWQRASDAGQDLSADDICRNHPELKVELSRQIDLMRRVKKLAQPEATEVFSQQLEANTESNASQVLTDLAPQQPLEIGNVLGNYTIVAKLGQGGMGQVFKAEHRRMKRVVALKVLPPSLCRDAATIARFEREVEAAAKLSHPNIVTAFDADEANGRHYLVMEYVDGADLSSVVREQGAFSIPLAMECILQAARGLEYAHRRGVIHRDIKPSNLLLCRETHESSASATDIGSRVTVKILDMGLARIDADDETPKSDLTATGAVMGTVDFMSPEQALDTRQADAQSDVYSLGCTLWFLLVGKPVFEGDTIMKRLLAHRETPVPSLSGNLRVDRAAKGTRDSGALDAKRLERIAKLDAVFRKMVAKRREDRFASMTEVIQSLQVVQRFGQTIDGNEVSSLSNLDGAAQADADSFASDSALVAEGALSSATVVMQPSSVSAGNEPAAAPLAPASSQRGRADSGSDQPPPPTGKKSWLLWAGMAIVLLLGVIVFKITKPDGTVTKLTVPEGTEVDLSSIPKGSKVEITESGMKPDVPGKASNGWHGWPAEAPPAAIAPFDAEKAKQHQEAWAKYLGVPVEYTNSIGMKFRLIPPGEFLMGSTEKEIEEALRGFGDNKLAQESIWRRNLSGAKGLSTSQS